MQAVILGSAAGGGVPQWNCRCPVCSLAWAGDPRVRPRTQSSLAVSADGEHWLVVNASPDIRQQIGAVAFPLVAAALMAAYIMLARELLIDIVPPLPRLLLLIGTGGILFAALVFALDERKIRNVLRLAKAR